MAIKVCFTLKKQHFFLGYLYQLSFISVWCHFALTLKKWNNVFSWNSLCCFSWQVLYYLKSSCQVPSYLPSLSPNPFHLSVSAAPQIFLLLFLYSFRLFWPHVWSASQVFLLSIHLGKWMSSAYFLLLPSCSAHWDTCSCELPWPYCNWTLALYSCQWFLSMTEFTHTPVQFSEEHLKNATEKVFFFNWFFCLLQMS